MSLYAVTWAIDIEAQNPREAAKLAQAKQQTNRPGYWVGVFSVTDSTTGQNVLVDLDSERTCTCANCDWTGPESELGRQLEDTPNLGERLDPGSTVPAGECPKCGALAYIEDEEPEA